jgi:hypothetical protein
MTKKTLVFLVLIFNLNSLISQIPGDFPTVTKVDLPGAKFSQPRIFNGTSLFGYIDGGAELYLEYGFSMVTVPEIDYMGGKYKTEIYRMNGPEEAFGIFSVSKFRCAGMPAVSDYTCQTKYQLQICKGPYYVSIINSTGTKNDSIASLKIGEIIAGKIKDEQIDLSSLMPGISINELKHNCILAKGKLGIVNGSPDLEDFFSGTRNYTAVIVSGGKKFIAIRFDSSESLEKFLVLHNWKNDTPPTGISLKRTGDFLLNIEMEN